jgi:hypothetical protein
MLVIGHDVIRIVDQALGAVGEADRQQISVGPLATASFGVNYEILDLKEVVQAEIPAGNLRRGCLVRAGPAPAPGSFRRLQHLTDRF